MKKKGHEPSDIHLRGTVKFEDIDVDQDDDDLDELAGMLDAVQGYEADASTDPFMPTLAVADNDPGATLQQPISSELIERAMGRQAEPNFPPSTGAPAPPTIPVQSPPAAAVAEFPLTEEEGWVKRHATVSRRGILAIYVVDSGFEPGDKVEVYIRKKQD